MSERRSRVQKANDRKLNPHLQRGGAGDEAIKKDRETQALKKEAQGKFPAFRFKLPQPKGSVGNESTIIILDANIEDRVTCSIHEIYDPSRSPKMAYDVCIGETNNCPHCDGRNPKNMQEDNKGGQPRPKFPSRVVSFTVIEHHPNRPYTNKQGVQQKSSKRLLSIKSKQWTDTMADLIAEAQHEYGTIRGVMIKMKRHEGTGMDEPAIGKPQKFKKDGFKKFGKMSEANLVKNFGHAAIVNDQGHIIKEENDMIRPFDYDEEFPYLTEKMLCAKWGLPLPQEEAASESFDNYEDDIEVGPDGFPLEDGDDLGQDDNDIPTGDDDGLIMDDDDFEDEVPEHKQEAKPSRRTRGKPAAAAEPADDDLDDESTGGEGLGDVGIGDDFDDDVAY